MKSLGPIIASPVLCLSLLGGIVVEGRTHAKPSDAIPFHDEARQRLEAWPRDIDGEWTSVEEKVPDAAVKLLRPNALISRFYVSTQNGYRSANLLVVQCREPSDMCGHYPPNCYPSSGQPLLHSEPRQWQVADTTIRGIEYHFAAARVGDPQIWVYNFFVLPGRGIVPDMKDVRQASGDYQRRHYGAAQVQVVFKAELSQDVRDEIFTALMKANVGVFKVLDPFGR